MPLYNTVRPRTWADLVGQDRVQSKLEHIRQCGGLLGQAFLLTGPAGVGKSTIAALICDEVCGSPDCITTLGARKLKTEELDSIVTRCQGRPLFGKAHGFIVEEVQQLHPHILNDLKVVLEDYAVQRTSVWCFTGTPQEIQARQTSMFGELEESAGNPFLSRCHVLEMDCGEKATLAFALHLRKIASDHSLDGRPIADYVQFVRKNKWNLRLCIQRIEEGYMKVT